METYGRMRKMNILILPSFFHLGNESNTIVYKLEQLTANRKRLSYAFIVHQKEKLENKLERKESLLCIRRIQG